MSEAAIIEALKELDKIPEPFKTLLIILGIIYLTHLTLKALMRLFKTVERFVHYIELKIYYPIITRILKRKQKEYVRKYLKNLTTPSPDTANIGLEYDIEIEWSNEEKVLIDLEKGALLIRVPYTTNIQEIIAKALVMASPYAISQYLEPVFGTKLARIFSIAIARDYASKDINVLREFEQYVNEIYKENEELRKLIEYINIADDTSLYRHIVLYELKKVLETYNGQVNKDWLESDMKSLIETVGSLTEISEPLVCGHYISLAIVRVGKLEKILLEEWGNYVNFIRSCTMKCRNIQRIYTVSAGKFIKEVAKKLTEYLTSNVPEMKLVEEVSYRARYYKGKTNVPQYIAIFEIE